VGFIAGSQGEGQRGRQLEGRLGLFAVQVLDDRNGGRDREREAAIETRAEAEARVERRAAAVVVVGAGLTISADPSAEQLARQAVVGEGFDVLGEAIAEREPAVEAIADLEVVVFGAPGVDAARVARDARREVARPRQPELVVEGARARLARGLELFAVRELLVVDAGRQLDSAENRGVAARSAREAPLACSATDR
jgi:hypothetical protein